MLIGVPKEIKDNEYRVGFVPSMVRELTDRGHRVLVETRAGMGAGFADNSYQTAGAEIVPDGDTIFTPTAISSSACWRSGAKCR